MAGGGAVPENDRAAPADSLRSLRLAAPRMHFGVAVTQSTVPELVLSLARTVAEVVNAAGGVGGDELQRVAVAHASD